MPRGRPKKVIDDNADDGMKTSSEPQIAPEAKKVPCLLLYDLWDDDGTRQKAGVVMDIEKKQAIKLMDAGKVQRADPLP